MKRLTLNETWVLCLRMWKWIAGQWKKGNKVSVNTLKDEWLEKHGFGYKDTIDNCFFCHYVAQTPQRKKEYCKACPGKRVDKDFDCCDDDYHYRLDPIAFYKKLVSLNRKRLKKGK